MLILTDFTLENLQSNLREGDEIRLVYHSESGLSNRQLPFASITACRFDYNYPRCGNCNKLALNYGLCLSYDILKNITILNRGSAINKVMEI